MCCNRLVASCIKQVAQQTQAKHCFIVHFLLGPLAVFRNTGGRTDVGLLRVVCLGIAVNLCLEPLQMADALAAGEIDAVPFFTLPLALIAGGGFLCSVMASEPKTQAKSE